MQRSRRALLRRRASDKPISARIHLYKVSLSLVFLLWGFLFLVSLWVSQGDGYKGSFPETEEQSGIKAHEDRSHPIDGTKNCIPARDAPAEESNPDPNTMIDKDPIRIDRVSHAVPPHLDEFKSKTFNSKPKSGNGQHGGVLHKVEPGGSNYNYASASKGAKVLSFNKEAKGAANILCRDKDKYLRNPCSAEEKYVIIELSEETLVQTIEIGNFEHHSSNLKEFELLGSLVYPTDSWEKLGNFSAANIKLAQRYSLLEPKWVRYLKLNLLSHHGHEFYCTLSVLEVYGVDAVERMLEDLISIPQNPILPAEEHSEKKMAPESAYGDNTYDSIDSVLLESDSVWENSNKHDVKNMREYGQEGRPQIGRMPGDTVLKILMQKVRSLDLSLSVLELYLEELNSRYGNILKELDTDIGDKTIIMERIKADIKVLHQTKEATNRDVGDLMTWKSDVSLVLDNLLRDNAILRSQVEKVQERQMSMENKGIVVFVVCITFALVAVVRILIDSAISFCSCFLSLVHSSDSNDNNKNKPRDFCSSSWQLLLFSCITILFVLSL